MGVKAIKGYTEWVARGKINNQNYWKKSDIPIRNPNKVPQAAIDFDMQVRAEFKRKMLLSADSPHIADKPPADWATMKAIFFDCKARKHLRPKTIQGYQWVFNSLEKKFKHLDDCRTLAQLELYVAKRYTEKIPGGRKFVGTNTIRAEIKQLLDAWRLAVAHGIDMPPVPPMPKNFKPEGDADPAREGKYREPRLVRRLIKECASREAKDRVILIALTGLRDEELDRLSLVNVFSPPNPVPGLAMAVYIPKDVAKKRKARWIGLSPLAWKVWQRSVPFKSRTNKGSFKGASKRMGLEYTITPRDLRASFATGAKVNGADQTFINIVMGHTPDVPAVYQKATMYGLAVVAEAALAWLKSDRKALSKCGRGVDGADVLPFAVKPNVDRRA